MEVLRPMSRESDMEVKPFIHSRHAFILNENKCLLNDLPDLWDLIKSGVRSSCSARQYD